MKIYKFCKRWCFLLIFVFLCSQVQVFAEGFILIHPTDDAHEIRNHRGVQMAPPAAHVEFFTSVPADPRSSDGALVPLATGRVGDFYQYEFGQRGVITVRAWEGDVGARGSYYGTTNRGTNRDKEGTPSEAMNMLAPPAPAYHYAMNTFSTMYQLEEPWVPELGAIGESMIRSGEELQLTLTVSVDYDEEGAGRVRRKANSYNLQVIYPEESGREPETLSGGATFTLRDVPSGTYQFRAGVTNWYGTVWSDALVAYETLGLAGGGGPGTANFNLVRQEDGLGINPVTYPFSPVEGMANVRDLISRINTQADANVVTAVGWWNTATMAPAGYSVLYTSDGELNSFDRFISIGGAPDDPTEAALSLDMSLQVSVIAGAEVDWSGIR